MSLVINVTVTKLVNNMMVTMIRTIPLVVPTMRAYVNHATQGMEEDHLLMAGLASSLTFNWCSASSLGTPGMSLGFQANISWFARRKSTSALSYAE